MVGVRTRDLGLIDTGIMMGVKPRSMALGWDYGSLLVANQESTKTDVYQAELIRTNSMVGYDFGAGSYSSGRTSAAILPAVFSWVDSTPTGYEWEVPDEGDVYVDRSWIWSSESFRDVRYEQIHAFDIEVEVGLFLYVRTGFSPGELVDFVLGIFTIDIAGDDGALRLK